MFYLIALMLLIASLIAPKNKSITFVWLVFYWVLFAFNTYNGDYVAYNSIYNYIGVGQERITSVSEEGFIWLARVSSVTLKLSYSQFLILMASLSTVLLAMVLLKYASSTNIVLALFLVYPYWIMICQYRSYISILFVLLGLYYLFDRTGRDAYLLFFCLIFLGGLFHRSAWLFAFFFLAKRYDIKHVTVAALVIGITLRVLVVNDTLSTIASGIVSERKAVQWLSGDVERSALGIVLLFLFRAMMLYVEYWMLSQLRRIGARGDRRIRLFEYMLRVSVLCTTFLVFEMGDRNYERLFRVELFMFYVFVADYLEIYFSARSVSIGDIPVRYICALLFLGLYIVYFEPTLSGWIDHNFYPVFESNAILSSLGF